MRKILVGIALLALVGCAGIKTEDTAGPPAIPPPPAGTAAELTAGTETALRSWSPKILSDQYAGAGSGDMTKAEYDANDDGEIDDGAIPSAIARDTELSTASSLHLDDLLTAIGIASEATHLGTFTGSTIDDNQTAKAAIQALETAVEAVGGDITGVLGDDTGAVPYLYQSWAAFTAEDTTPDVSAGQFFRTVDTTTISGFDHGAGAITDGRMLVVYCGAATVFDLTSSEITAANRSTDYTATAGMVLNFVYYTDQWYALNIPDEVTTLDDSGTVSLIGTAGSNTPTLYAIDTDLSDASASDDTWASAKAIKSALDGKQATLTNPLVQADVDDTPVDGVDTAPVSSNWAYDHEADTSTHGVSGAIVGTSDEQTLTNKTFDANATGNVLKGYGYITLTSPHIFASGVTQQTTATARSYGQALFPDDVDVATNYVEYVLEVPRDLDTSVDLVAWFSFVLSDADTADHDYVISMIDIAASADNGTAVGDAINLDYTADASGASGDVETAGGNTLTGWAAALTSRARSSVAPTVSPRTPPCTP